MENLTPEFINTNFVAYHVRTVKEFIGKVNLDTIPVDLASYSLDILISGEGMTLQQIATRCDVEVGQIKETFYSHCTKQELTQIK